MEDITNDFLLLIIAQFVVLLVAIPYTVVKLLILIFQLEHDGVYVVSETLEFNDWHHELWVIYNLVQLAYTLVFDGYLVSEM
mmetsp:Transcript_25948/g.39762  ORF Transcript_25948/g.39762 Transcript_25948/m.39762 type:complete len:82 (-) Transcript_25948:140-385(-)